MVWPSLFERQRRLIPSATMLAARGRVRREGEVVHVVAKELTDLSALLRGVGDRERMSRAVLPDDRGPGDVLDPRPRPDPGCAVRVTTRDFR